jgi:hypothetical protein
MVISAAVPELKTVTWAFLLLLNDTWWVTT